MRKCSQEDLGREWGQQNGQEKQPRKVRWCRQGKRGEPVACFLGVRGVSGASELVPFGGAKVGVSPLHWPCTGDEPSEHSGCRHPGEMRYRNVTGNRSGARCPGVGRALTKPLA